MIDFHYNTLNAKIQGLSVQVGELFADLHRSSQYSEKSLEALEAYKSLRRLLPREWPNHGTLSRHIGATAAHNSTQGVMA